MNSLAERVVHDPNVAAETEYETLDLVRYVRSIGRNKWRILALVIAVGVLAAIYALSLAPIYRGTATVLIEANKQKIVSIEEVYNQAAGANREFYQTQYEILRSRDLTAKLVDRLKLTDHALFDPRQRPKAWYAGLLPEGFLGDEASDAGRSSEAIRQAAIRAVTRDLSIQLVRNSQLVRISFDSRDKELSARVPNTLAEIYIESDLASRLQMTQKATSWLTEQSADLRSKLAASEKALQSFRERERIIDTKGLAQAGATKQIEDLNKSLNDARAKRADAENVYNQVIGVLQGKSQESLESLPAIQRQPLVMRLKEQESDSEKKLADASKRYGPEHPRMVSAESELKSAREAVRRQIASVAQSVTREFEVAKANEASLEKALNSARGDVQNLNRKEFELATLERDVATSRQFYDMFVQRFKETNISGDLQTAIARVVDPAVVPETSFGPNRRLIVGLSLLAALLAGVSLALLIERLHNTLKTTHDVETKLGLPSLGTVQITKPQKGRLLEREFLEDPQTSFSEAIRTIRSAVMLSALDSPKKIVVITSSVPGEGKTTVAANLAFALSQLKPTLLIDADMRRPRIGRVLGGQQALLGLSELCSGAATTDKCIYPVKDSQLSVLPSGKVPPNPQELLSSHRFEEMLAMLSEQFEFIVIDSPPVQLVSDALVISPHASEVVYVVKADETPFPLAQQGVKKLRRVGAPLIGAVLNQLDVLKADKYYGEYSGYGKKYYGRKYGYGYTGKGS